MRFARGKDIILEYLRLLYDALFKKKSPFTLEQNISIEDVLKDPKVFISFVRSDLEIAEKFECALRDKGLEVFRYAPGKRIQLEHLFKDHEFTLKRFREENPGIAEEVFRQIRGSFAIIFILSEDWIKSRMCEMEAQAAFFPGSFVSAHSYLVRMNTKVHKMMALKLPHIFDRVYKAGIEETIARYITQEIYLLTE